MLCTINDFEKVHRILSHESVYPFISDDYCPEKPAEDLGIFYFSDEIIKVLMPNESSVFICVPLSNNVYSVHSNVLPERRGKAAIRAGRDCAKWMFNNTECSTIISFTPIQNKAALMFSSLVGFKRIGIIEKSFKKNGVFQDQVITGLNKGEL